MRIGYCKLGRSMPLSPAKFAGVGGDQEPPILLNKLARRLPDHEFVVIGRNSGEEPSSVGLPSNITNPWTEWREEASAKMREADGDVTKIVHALDVITMSTWVDLDAVIVWAGQHGTSNSPLPVVGGGQLTNPQISFVNYGSYVVRGISVWRDQDPHGRQEMWLCPDPRNYLKCRDLKWPPPPIIGQFKWSKQEKHYRYDDPTDPGFFGCTWDEHNVWKATHTYGYDALELCGIPTTIEFSDEWEGRGRFGSIMNETRTGIKRSRLEVMKDWILPLQPDWVAGNWSPASQRKLGVIIEPIPWHTVFQTWQMTHATLAAPAVGTGWTTTKPWECFAAGTVCFFHPYYDTQDNVLGTPGFEALKQWLRVDSPETLRKRVDAVHSSRETFEWIVREQRRLFDQRMAELQCINEIERRLGVHSVKEEAL